MNTAEIGERFFVSVSVSQPRIFVIIGTVFLAESQSAIDIDPAFTYGMAGNVSIDPKAIRPNALFRSPVPDATCPDIEVRDIRPSFIDPSQGVAGEGLYSRLYGRLSLF